MRYILLNQNYGAAEVYAAEVIKDGLTIEVDRSIVNVHTPFTIKIIGENGTVNYYTVNSGKCLVPSRHLKGRLSVSVIYEGGVIPCTGILAVRGEGGAVSVLPDPKDTTERLIKAERDISDALEALKRTEAKYESITEGLDKLFSGYHY